MTSELYKTANARTSFICESLLGYVAQDGSEYNKISLVLVMSRTRYKRRGGSCGAHRRRQAQHRTALSTSVGDSTTAKVGFYSRPYRYARSVA